VALAHSIKIKRPLVPLPLVSTRGKKYKKRPLFPLPLSRKLSGTTRGI
jgi:hypothetical protein